MDDAQQGDAWSKHTRVTEGEFAGWWKYGSDPFEDLAGPFYYREREDGRIEAALRAEVKHMNSGMFLHGGAAMTFADYSLFVIGMKALQGAGSVTASLTGDFIDTAKPGDLIIATGEVTRAGASLVFIRGQLAVEEKPIFTYSAILKRVRRK